MSRKEILIGGSGGQGVLFFGNILSLAAVQEGKKVVTTSSYGAAVRGGAVKCGVVISDEEIYDPVVSDADIVVTLNEASLEQCGPIVKKGGTLVCEESEKTAEIAASIKKPFQLISIPLRKLGPERYHNIIALGIFLQISPEMGVDLIKETLIKEIKKRGKESLVEENLKAIQAGIDWYQKEQKK